MFRISHVLILMMVVWCAGLLVWTSQSVQKNEKELASVRYKKNQEMEAARVLMSEWEYLNRPDRLEELIKDYQFVSAAQNSDVKILSVNDIKDPVVPMVPRTKPERFLHYVSTNKHQENASVLISKEDRFDHVVNSVLAGEER